MNKSLEKYSLFFFFLSLWNKRGRKILAGGREFYLIASWHLLWDTHVSEVQGSFCQEDLRLDNSLSVGFQMLKFHRYSSVKYTNLRTNMLNPPPTLCQRVTSLSMSNLEWHECITTFEMIDKGAGQKTAIFSSEGFVVLYVFLLRERRPHIRNQVC